MIRRMTVAQAIVAFLQNQYSARDSKEYQFIQGCFGIFGHGNVAGLGQALKTHTYHTTWRETNRRWCIQPRDSPRRVSECGRWPARPR